MLHRMRLLVQYTILLLYSTWTWASVAIDISRYVISRFENALANEIDIKQY